MRLEGNLAGVAALGADRFEHLAGCAGSGVTASVLAVGSACLASLRLVGEALFCVKLLLAGSKGEFLSAIFADQYFVAVHRLPSFLRAPLGERSILFYHDYFNLSITFEQFLQKNFQNILMIFDKTSHARHKVPPLAAFCHSYTRQLAVFLGILERNSYTLTYFGYKKKLTI